MEIDISERLKNYIIFSYIEKLVLDLSSVFLDDEHLNSYYHMMSNSDRLNETEDFVKGFKRALDGTKKAVYAPGIFLDIPKFMASNQKNKEIIKEYLTVIKGLYENISECKELKYMQQSSEEISDQNLDEIAEQGTEKPQVIQQIVEKITKTITDKVKNNLSNVDHNLVLKFFVVGLYDYPFEKDFGEDSEHFRKIIEIVINTPINDLKNKKMLILREILSVKSIPVTEIFAQLKS